MHTHTHRYGLDLNQPPSQAEFVWTAAAGILRIILVLPMLISSVFDRKVCRSPPGNNPPKLSENQWNKSNWIAPGPTRNNNVSLATIAPVLRTVRAVQNCWSIASCIIRNRMRRMDKHAEQDCMQCIGWLRSTVYSVYIQLSMVQSTKPPK